MGWRELQGWLEAVKRQQEGEQVTPDSWKNADRDPWWVEARAERDRKRRGV